MKHRTIGLTAALFAALIGTAFLFTACWQGNPAGGSDMPGGGGAINPGGTNPGGTNPGNTNPGNTNPGNTASSIEGSWKANGGQLVLQLKSGKVTYTSTVGGEVSDSGRYTITGATITFTDFTSPGVKLFFNREFKYEIKGDTLTLSDTTTGTPMYQFKKA